MKRIPAVTAFVLAITFTLPALAAEQEPGDHQSAHQAGPAVKLHGKVNSINAPAGRVNITHDPVPELKWPAMKMNFKAHDPALLKDVKPGMSVDFEIQKMGSEYQITRITPAQ
jgi:Cu(I)/Ag(I) efflux system membrane fusion protein